MCYISVRPERHSYEIIKRTGEFVINLTNSRLSRATDWCGVRSGRDYDKFAEMGLTAEAAAVVKAPIVAESPVAIECRVKQIIPLGSHDMFIGEVVNVAVDERYLDAETGKLDVEKMHLLTYAHGGYFTLGEKVGTFGWTVKGSTLRKELKQGKQKAKR
jgi:flavin reductase (DIM6/NTAB) family NADH-FMN oxidoreductase RutF